VIVRYHYTTTTTTRTFPVVSQTGLPRRLLDLVITISSGGILYVRGRGRSSGFVGGRRGSWE
jgi:hypothetical protein